MKRNISLIILWFLFSVTALVAFILYGISLEPFFYASAISLFFLICFIIGDKVREKKRAKERELALSGILSEWKNLPEAETPAEADYQKMIEKLGNELERITSETDTERQDSLDYYTAWVHQIKTPIAVMRLKLSEDTPENRALLSEIFRIEQYVDMVLQYIRLGSESKDLIIREYPLDELIKESIKKFAPQFIEKKLALNYNMADKTITTDKKWFCCILEQFLSNAIKYTSEGSITITVKDDEITVSDTGIGIAPEDQPRIFEKGFTGNNGRIGEKSSGLGLYLAKRAADLLNLSLGVTSTVGKGSHFTIRNFEK